MTVPDEVVVPVVAVGVMVMIEPVSEIEESAMTEELENLTILLAVPEPVTLPEAVVHAQTLDEALHCNTCESEQPPKRRSPVELASRPELAEVVVVVEVVVTSKSTVTLSVDAAVVTIPLPAPIVIVSPLEIV